MFFNFKHLFGKIIVIGVLSMISAAVVAKDAVIHVKNIDNHLSGNIMVMLFEKEGFPKNHAKAIVTNVIPVTNEKVIVRFTSVPDEFAIKILHDEDKTGEVTKNWTGVIPSEGLGFSNGAKLRFGPPNFECAKLIREDVNGPITISIIYP